jgi:hypothetical protein
MTVNITLPEAEAAVQSNCVLAGQKQSMEIKAAIPAGDAGPRKRRNAGRTQQDRRHDQQRRRLATRTARNASAW